MRWTIDEDQVQALNLTSDGRANVSRNFLNDESSIQISQVAIDICNQLQEATTVTESDMYNVVFSP